MSRLNEDLHVAYAELGRFLQNLPDGMEYIQIQAKLPTLRNLNKKELAALLEFSKERDRIDVTEIKKEDGPRSHLLRHKQYVSAPTVVPQGDPKSGQHVVHVATGGRYAIDPKKTFVPPKGSNAPVKSDNTTKGKLTEPEASKLVYSAVARSAALGDPVLVKAAEEIYNELAFHSNGLTRTELGLKVIEYHLLRGANRNIVLSHLLAREGVIQRRSDEPGKFSAPRYVHPKFAKDLEKGEKRFDHTAPDIALDPIPQPEERKTLSMPVKVVHATPARTPDVITSGKPANDLTGYSVREKALPTDEALGELIMDLLKATSGKLPVMRLHNYITGYSEVPEEIRTGTLRRLVKEGNILNYQAPSPNSQGKDIAWIELAGPGTLTEVYPVENVPTAMAAAFQTAKEEKENEMLPLNTLKAEETATPATPVAASVRVTPLSTSQLLKQQIEALTQMAKEAEEKEKNDLLLSEVSAMRDELTACFDASQKALDAQIDAQASLGMALEKLNALLSK